MRMRSLSVSVLAAVVLVPLGGAAASASTSPSLSTTAMSTHVWKNSATKRHVAPRTAAVAPVAVRTAPVVVVPVVTAPTPTTYAGEVLRLTNLERTSRGLRPLAASACATRFADAWALQLSLLGALSHQSMTTILSSCSARGVGENVAYGNVSPAQLVTMWMNSEGHRANILNPAFTHVGISALTTATGRVYGVQDFLTV